MPAAAENEIPPGDEYRKQLILAQVQILELEDLRDELSTRLAAANELLRQCQTLADEKIAALAYETRVRAEVEGELSHLRHLQPLTEQALQETRSRLAAANVTAESLRAVNTLHGARIAELEAERAGLADRLREMDTSLQVATALAQERLARMQVLDAERRAMQASLSWRLTSPVRSVERWRTKRNRP